MCIGYTFLFRHIDKPIITIAMTKLLAASALLLLALSLSIASYAQEKIITGKVTDAKDGSPVVGASVVPKGSARGASTGADGSFRVSVGDNVTTLVISSIGFITQEISISGKTVIDVSLQASNVDLNEVVVVGYGTQRRRDLTGAVGSVRARDFNKGIQTAPDQLIQGKVPGVQVINNSGAPGGGTTIKIRGNASIRTGNQPLFVVDGIILDGRSSRPPFSTNTAPGAGGVNTGLGQTPDANPLNFISTADIADFQILKDASATAIYGSRGANGVVLITTKKGTSGAPKVDVNYNVSVSNLMRKFKVLDAGEYRQALQQYQITGGDFGGDVDALDAILRTAVSQNLNLSFSGGNENGRYRVSLAYVDQQGILKKTDFKRYSANIAANLKFLESKKLGVDFNLIASQNRENIAPVTTDAGFTGSIVGQALQWNPTHPLRKPNDSIWIKDPTWSETIINPLAMSEAYDDETRINTIVGAFSPYYKITKDLELRMLYALNYSSGIRRGQIARWLNNSEVENRGLAMYGNNELFTQQLTWTLNYNTKLSSNLNLNALVGYEFMKFDYKGISLSAKDFGTYPLNYTDYLQYGSQNSRTMWSFTDPTSEIQSFFGRAVLNYDDKYILTATMRADGSTKFGENNKYGYFPSFAAAWNISNENFFPKGGLVNNLKLRAGWGQTGNQEFPPGAAVARYGATGPGSFSQLNFNNPDLKWQTDNQTNIGVDFGLFNDRLTGSVDYFHRKTKNMLYLGPAPVPGPTEYPTAWKNLEGEIVNSGVEVGLNGAIFRKKEFSWELGVNATFLDNEVSGLASPIIAGALHGQGMSNAFAQRIANGQPVNVFYTRQFEGLDKDGFSIYTDGGNTNFYVGNPNPKMLLGISTRVNYKQFSLEINMNGAFGHDIYNNTANSVLPVSNLSPSRRNVAKHLLNAFDVPENLANPVAPSSRFLEKGNYMKLANATISYQLGTIAKTFRNASVYFTGQNLFVITKYKGFDPEVNTDKQFQGVPSLGIDYVSYPSARTFMLGVNFSL